MNSTSLQIRNRRRAITAPLLAALVCVATGVPGFAQEVDVGRSLYDLKMKAKAACNKAKEYKWKKENAWKRHQNNPRSQHAREEYDLAYAIYKKQREICQWLKKGYIALRDARRFGSPTTAGAGDSEAPQGAPDAATNGGAAPGGGGGGADSTGSDLLGEKRGGVSSPGFGN